MKKAIILIFLSFSSFCFSQNFNWITPNKDYLKLYISSDGIYRINKIDFINAGIGNVNNINPKTVKVYYKGNEIPIFFYGENDGVFNDSDYFDFYGQRNYGGLTNTYKDVNGTMAVDYVTDEYFDFYSDTSVYWVGWDGAFGTRFVNYNITTSNDYPQNFFYNKIQFEKDLIYSLGEQRSPTDYRYFNNEKVSGEGWYWKYMQRGNSVSDTFRIPYLSTITQNCTLKLFAYPSSYVDSIFNEHKLIIRINGNILDTLYRDNYNKFDTTIAFPSSILSNSNLNTITITYTNPPLYAGVLYFDYFTLYYPKKLEFENSQLSFKSNLTDTTTRQFKIKGFNSSSEISIYDTKNSLKISNNSLSADTLIFTGKGNGNFEINNIYISKKPKRVKRKQVPNLATNTNGVDYLIVYTKLFESQAEQLRSYRNSHDNYRSFKAEIEDIYDIFNFGIENPIAVRNFVKYIYDNWQTPKIKYICLFGRGSLDPKKNNQSSLYYQNLVPVYGYPATDGYFANVNLGTYTYFQQIAIGRLPAYTVQEAQDIVNKIINYDNNQYDVWIKKFIFITGGFTRPQQIDFSNQSNTYINQYITPCPIAGLPVKIYRQDTSGQVSYNYQDSIKNAINSGGLIVNYIGHAASSTWDNGLEDPYVLSNGSKLPLIFSMTCFTGRNADPDSSGGRGFGEKFIFYPNKGAIGFVGTTGWSFYPGGGNTFNDYMLNGFSKDSLRRIGDIVKFATVKMSKDSLSFIYRNTLNCYNLLGDPASKLILPTIPEFDIQLNDFKISNPYPTLRENINLKIFPKNLGTCADSCKIRFQLFKNNQSNRIKDTVVRNWGFVDTINYNFSIDSAGSYLVKINLDPDNWFPLELKSNNSITIPIALKNISFVPLKPINNSVVNLDTVVFTGINPNIDPSRNNVKLILQIDTSKYFTSPYNQTYFNLNFSGVITRFKYRLPILDSNVVYYWRLNSIINNTDTSGWSEINKFVYYPNIIPKNELSKLSQTDDSLVTIYKKKWGQFSQNDYSNLFFNSDSLKINKFTGNLFAQSFGGSYSEASYFIINSREIYLIDSNLYWGGLNIAKVRKNDGALVEVKHFKFTSSTSSDSVINYLNTFNSNYILMVIKAIPIGTTDNISIALKNKFKTLGSIYIDSVNLQIWGRWSFISYPLSSGFQTSEAFLNPNIWAPVTASIQPQFQYDSGYVVNIIGPASKWKNFNWYQNLYNNSNISFDVFGKDSILLYSNITTNNYFNLDSINPSIYPNLKLIGKINVDTLLGYTSSSLSGFKLNYYPPPEIIADNYSFIKSDSILQEGDTIRISINYYNVGFTGTNFVINNWTASSPSGIRILKIDTTNYFLKKDSSNRAGIIINTAHLRKPDKPKDTIFVYYEAKLRNTENEFFTYNNTAVTSFILTGDSLKPTLDITYDGVKVQSGDYVQPKPVINVKVFDDSRMYIRDTSNIRVILDTQYVWYYINGVKNPLIDIIYPTKTILQATVIFKPILTDGDHEFKYIFYDNSGNYGDTLKYILTVNPQLKIYNLYSFPNPMKSQTSFVFSLSGNSIPNICKIKIFTVAGRLVKVINATANIGYNQILWDGRDDDGDYMANGVYLYKLIVDGDNKKETSVQKLVILK